MRLTAYDKRAVTKVEEKIRKDFTTSNRIIDWAELAGMSASKFKKAFYIVYGKPVHQYILHLKMAFAHEKILEDELTLTHIARLCGYRHTTNFISAFKKIYGYTPATIKPAN